MVCIVVSRYKKKVLWAYNLAQEHDINLLVYDKETPSNIFNIPVNKGYEASVYLRYILDFYDNLPYYTFFVQDDEYAWHHTGSISSQLQKALQSGEEYYNINDRCPLDGFHNSTWKDRYLDWYNEMIEPVVPKYLLPDDWMTGQRGCAQFLVHRNRIRRFPKSFYQSLYDWLMTTKLEEGGNIPAVFLEWTWHVLWSDIAYPRIGKVPLKPQMLYIFIRTCPRDDSIGRIAYESLVRLYPDATFVFLAEQGTYKHLIRDIVYRESAGNFGGHKGVLNLISTLQTMYIPLQDNDLVFLSDSDIVADKSILDKLDGVDHAGVLNTNRWNLHHISGQFQILRGGFLKRLLAMTNDELDSIVDEMVSLGIDIADDTFISFMSDRWELIKRDICEWKHHKFYQFNDRTDYDAILQTISQSFFSKCFFDML